MMQGEHSCTDHISIVIVILGRCIVARNMISQPDSENC